MLSLQRICSWCAVERATENAIRMNRHSRSGRQIWKLGNFRLGGLTLTGHAKAEDSIGFATAYYLLTYARDSFSLVS